MREKHSSAIYHNNAHYNEAYAIPIDYEQLNNEHPDSYWDTQKEFIHIFNKNNSTVEHFPILPAVTTIKNPYDRFFIEALCGFTKDPKNHPHKNFWKDSSNYWFFSYPLFSISKRLQRCLQKTTFISKTKQKIDHIICSSITTPTMGYQFLKSMRSLFLIACPYVQYHITKPWFSYSENILISIITFLSINVIRLMYVTKDIHVDTRSPRTIALDII